LSSALLSDGQGPPVTKRELTKFLGVSRTTLDAWIDRWPEFPIRERGSHGRGYKFDLREVCAFLRARQQEDADRRAERDEQLAQILLPFGPEPERPVSPGPSLDDQIKAMKLNEMRLAQAQRARQLVRAEDVRELFSHIWSESTRAMQAFVDQLAREQAWPAAILADRKQRLAEMQAETVRQAREFLRKPSEGNGK